MKQSSEISIFWFRRDLRLHDNHGLYRALRGDLPVLPLFIFDWNILSALPDSRDARVQFIFTEVQRLKQMLEEKWGSSMLIRYGKPEKVWRELLAEYQIGEVHTNRDYEPYARQRDQAVYGLLGDAGISFKGYKDHVLFDKNEIRKDDGAPYVVFTPYSKRYKSLLEDRHLQPFDAIKEAGNFWPTPPLPEISLSEMGFQSFDFEYPSREMDAALIENYHRTRDVPGIRGTSRLSLHLRHGTLSIREVARQARRHNEKFFNELIWRDFYQSILYHFPHSMDQAFRPAYDRIRWENNEAHFEAWCAGRTGYPLVDAGMRELNQTGFMHNRIRMLTASFLTKHLLIDWRWGERYFAGKLLDYEAASNVGGWQWAAGSGVDAAPYFRIFSPERQLQRFDKDLRYVQKWVPEYDSDDYPSPIVDHKAARERALARYKEALS